MDEDDDDGMNAKGGPEPLCLTCGHLWGSHRGEFGGEPCYECGCTPFVWPDGLRGE